MTEKIMWGRVALVVVVIVVVAAAGAFALLGRGPTQEGRGPAGEEYAWVQYTASFELLSTSDNGPVENLVPDLPYPHFMPERFLKNVSWIEDANTISMAAKSSYDNFLVTFLPGSYIENREPIIFTPPFENETSWIRTYIPPTENNLGVNFPRVGVIVSNLYPNDEFQIDAWLRVPKENLNRLTLIDVRSTAEKCTWISTRYVDKSVSISVRLEMKKVIDDTHITLENWSGTRENTSGHVTIFLTSN